MTNKTEIRAAVEKVLRQVQAASGRSCPAITDRTKPIGEIAEFDSLMGEEATMMLEVELGCSLGKESAFVSTDRTRALKVSEVVDRVSEMIARTS